MCDSETKRIVAEGHAKQLMGVSFEHYTSKGYDAFYQDGIGDGKALSMGAITLVTGDNVANNITTTRTLDVDGAAVVSTIDIIGDDDFFKVELVEGRTYDFSQFLTTTGPNGVPLADAFLELYDADGKFIVSADGGGPNTPSGLDAILTYTAKASGTYYINAKAYDDSAVGDYEIFVNDVSDRPSYKPYYDVDSPLHSIDWGTQVDRTSRNPDGEEGPRPTGNPFQEASNEYGIQGKNVITVYFAKAGDVFLSQDPTNPGLTENMVAKGFSAWEKKAFFEAFAQYENVSDLVFIEVNTREQADFKLVTYNGTPGVGASLLGRMNPPDEGNEGQGEFNAGDARWSEAGLQKGGFYFPTLLHELGHGLGMAHPHDNGGRSSVMRGAGTGDTDVIGGGYGDFDLSQQVHTIMSYNDGWQTSGYGTPKSGGITGTQVDHFGWVASLSPFDIAVIQDKYGVNASYNKGDNVYTLKDVNAVGTFYESIWDAGGTDQIVYNGARNATIDLRPATLKYEEGGGGRVSHAFGIHGGFTIANGVTVENAASGSGNDKLFGNDAANRLESGAGDDSISGGAGNDTIVGGTGKDTLTGGDGADTFVFAAGDSGILARDVITDFAKGTDQIDLDAAGAKAFIGSRGFSGTAGEVRTTAANGTTLVQLDSNGDRIADLEFELTGEMALTAVDFGDLMNERLVGTLGDDVLQGLEGDDVLIGLAGNDVLDGGTGNDTADYSGTTHNLRLDLDLATAQDTGLTGFDTLISVENLIGGGGANTFYGSAESNRLEGRGGNDLLDGRGGDDFIVGGAGSDQLAGRAGSDTFILEAVSDSLAGSNRDRITDFTSGADRIDLSLIDAVSGSGGNDAFTFIGSDAFSGVAGQLRYFSSSSGTIVAGDVNGDGVADFEIQLTNKAVPVETDFVL
jgi:Ca2+-binding RTX toxin-like protein